MVGWILDRLVARAIPPDVEDPAQERIAEAAAENAIRHVVTVAGIASVFVLAGFAALLYGFLPSEQTGHGASQPASEVPSRSDADYAKLLQAKEESEGKLQQVITERDALQGKVAELEQQREELTKSHPETAGAAAGSENPAERAARPTKIGELERQVAELTQKLHTTRAAAADRTAHLLTPARPSHALVSAARRRAYRCGDGRTVGNPATCSATASAPRAVRPSVPDTYFCGDGRSVPHPADCRAAGALEPRR
jgi:hypothetical protein